MWNRPPWLTTALPAAAFLAGTAVSAGTASASVPATSGDASPAAVSGPAEDRTAAAPAAHVPEGPSGSLQTASPRERALRVEADPDLEGIARRLATDPAVLAPMPGIGDPLEVLSEPPTLWVVRDLGRVPGAGAAMEEVAWVAGFADHRRNLMAVRVGPGREGDLEALRRTTRHELAHLALEAVTGGAPRWLHEGYAQLATGEWEWEEAWRIQFGIFRGGGQLLERLTLDFPTEATDARLAYLLSYTAVQELAAIAGQRGLEAFFRELARGHDVDQALRNVFGLTLGQFEDRWRESVSSRYGWLYFFSRASVFWLFLTLLLLLVGWRRWRYNKQRWEELRRADAREEARGGWGGPGDGSYGGASEVEPWADGPPGR